MKIRDRVCRKDIPEIVVVVIAIRHGARAKVLWPGYVGQWHDLETLKPAGNAPQEASE